MPFSSSVDAFEPVHQSQIADLKIVLLAGGVGGAKLADGVAQLVPPENLAIIVNTGDDFQHFGLTICPDLDTVMYTLAAEANLETGWGRASESWRTLEEVVKLGGPDWFRLGDLDLATHLVRTHLISSGSTLTAATQALCQHFDMATNVLPMTDEAAPTKIVSDEGVLPFQTWFVARRWQPAVRKIELPEYVRTTAQIVTVLEKADLIIIAPSNPFVSIEPILNVYPIREMITDLPELVVAVSPIIAGEAVKGPAAKMMLELGMEVSAASVADYYGDLLDVYIYDQRDESVLERPNLIVKQVDTMMYNRADRRRLAGCILQDSLEIIYS